MKSFSLLLLIIILIQINILQAQKAPNNDFVNVYSSSVAFADIDNDNDQDVLITGQSYEVIAKLYLNDGDGNYTESSITYFEGVYAGSVSFADIDNDNDQDVLISGINNNNQTITRLYKNIGSGEFETVINTPFVDRRGASTFSDIDNDNDQDVLISGSTYYGQNSTTRIYKNNGLGDFTELPNTPFEDIAGGEVAFLDVDNDNDKDLLIAGIINNEAVTKLYLNSDGLGLYVEVTDTPFFPAGSSSIACTDVDNDNDIDILLSGSNHDDLYYSPTTRLYKNDGVGNFMYSNSFTGVTTGSVAFTDFDNDYDMDILITGDTTYPGFNPITKLYRNDGLGNYLEILNTPFVDVRLSSVAFSDVENDGFQDLLITGRTSSGAISILYYNINNIVDNIPAGTIDNIFSEIDIYPNPALGKIYISPNNNLRNFSIIVRNINGKIVKQEKIKFSNKKSIDISTLNQGIYFIQVLNNEKQYIKKIVKK